MPGASGREHLLQGVVDDSGLGQISPRRVQEQNPVTGVGPESGRLVGVRCWGGAALAETVPVVRPPPSLAPAQQFGVVDCLLVKAERPVELAEDGGLIAVLDRLGPMPPL